jgi:hypothetical protein
MDVLLHLPEGIGERLETRREDLPRWATEAWAVEAYKAGALTSFEVGKMLGHSSRWETEDFLKRAGAYLHYTEDDLARDVGTLRRRIG